ncbi:MAG: hypothetical protein V7606_4808, partial [Burkholderiales bacterium]
IPKARKEAVLSKMLSPNPPTISALAKQEGISEATLYNWRKQLRHIFPDSRARPKLRIAMANGTSR